MSQVEKKIPDDANYEKLLNVLKLGINKIRKKVVEGFFSYEIIKEKLPKRIKKIHKKKEEKIKIVQKSENESYKVCKKIAEILFKKVELKTQCKKKLESLSNEIESFLHKNSKDDDDYKKRVL